MSAIHKSPEKKDRDILITKMSHLISQHGHSKHASFVPQTDIFFSWLYLIIALYFAFFVLSDSPQRAFFLLVVLYAWDASNRRFCDELFLCVNTQSE